MIIQSGCTIYSAIIEDEVLVSSRSIVLEGSRLENGCVIGPNSVVPPGRIIPSYQLWAGNPVAYVRDLTKQEKVFMLHYAKLQLSLTWAHKAQFLPYRSSYLFKNEKDEEVEEGGFRDTSMNTEFAASKGSLNSIYN